jgi:hypothetical protein
MKKSLLIALGSASFFGLSAQKFVSTTPSNKIAVVEEFTGKTCGYCPDGHKRVDELIAANPGKVIGINVHAGSYASGTPNYRCSLSTSADYGQSLYQYTGVNLTGFPAGTVNRTLFSGHSQNTSNPGTAMSRGSFATTAAMVFAESSPVNVALKANYDIVKKLLYVQVEVYYTATEANATNKITVGLMQDNIWGPQSSGSTYPAKWDASKPVGSQYRHMKMLRAIITDSQWGDDINTTTTGSLFSKTYVYSMPDKIGDVDVDPTELSVYAVIAQNEQIILTGTKEHVVVSQGELDPTNPENVLSVNNAGLETGTGLFPNPATENTFISINASVSEVAQVKIVNIAGMEVSSFETEINAGNNQVKVDLSNLGSGYYFVELGRNGNVERLPLIVK